MPRVTIPRTAPHAQALSLLARCQLARAEAVAASTARDHAARLRFVRPLMASRGAQEIVDEAADFLAALDGEDTPDAA